MRCKLFFVAAVLLAGCASTNPERKSETPALASSQRMSQTQQQADTDTDRDDRRNDALSQDKEDHLPSAVRSSFVNRHPKAQVLDVDEDIERGRATYEIKYIERGVKRKSIYRADGRLIKTRVDDDS